MSRWVRRLPGVMRVLVRESTDNRVVGLAAEVAFFGVLSLFPGLLFLATALGFLEALLGNGLARQAEEPVLRFLDQVLTDRAAGNVEAVRELFVRPQGGLLTVASLLALWGLSRGFVAVIRALDLAYDVAHRPPWCAVGGVGWLVVSAGFSTYLRLAAAGNQVLRALGGGLILLPRVPPRRGAGRPCRLGDSARASP
jgi:uncharacterized BrkB/YihY/UPF0761 family membrane protein